MKLAEHLQSNKSRIDQLLGRKTFQARGDEMLKAIRSAYKPSADDVHHLCEVGCWLTGTHSTQTTNVWAAANEAVKRFDDQYSQWVEEAQKLMSEQFAAGDDPIEATRRSLRAEALFHSMDFICAHVRVTVCNLVVSAGEFLARLLELCQQLKEHAGQEPFELLRQYAAEVALPAFKQISQFETQALMSTGEGAPKLMAIRRQIGNLVVNKPAPWMAGVVKHIDNKRPELDKQRLLLETTMEGVAALIKVRKLYADVPHVVTRWTPYVAELAALSCNQVGRQTESAKYRWVCYGGGYNHDYVLECDQSSEATECTLHGVCDVAVIKAQLHAAWQCTLVDMAIRNYAGMAEDCALQLLANVQLTQVVERQLAEIQREKGFGFADQDEYQAGANLDRTLAHLAGRAVDQANTLYLTALTMLTTFKHRNRPS